MASASSANFFTTASHPYAEHRATRKEKADLLAIDRLVASSGCTAAYLDIGSNIGVQLRKLVEPARYRGALAVQIYDEVFGPSERVDRCRVCAIGFEPNPRHARRLDQLEATYKAAGAPVLVLRGAASTFSGEEQFFLHKNATLDTGAHTGFIHPRKMHERCQKLGSGCQDEIYSQIEMATVRAIDLAKILEHLRAALLVRAAGRPRTTTKTSSVATRLPPPPPVIVAKMDIEAAEYELLPHLLESNALCGVSHLLLEWHPHVRGEAFGNRIRRSVNASLTSRSRGSCALPQLSEVDDQSYMGDGVAWPSANWTCGKAPSTDAAEGARMYKRHHHSRAHAAAVAAAAPRKTVQVALDLGVAAAGFCRPTHPGWEGDCERGEQGTWPLRRYPHLNSLDACVARCRQCSRCRYVSFMAARQGADLQTGDCSWYRCCDTANGTPNTRFPGFSTVQVRPWPAGANLSFCA